jgi:hypothetical protein
MIQKFEEGKSYYIRFSLLNEYEIITPAPVLKSKCMQIVKEYPFNEDYAYFKVKGTGGVMIHKSNVFNTKELAEQSYIIDIQHHISKLKNEIEEWNETLKKLGHPG